MEEYRGFSEAARFLSRALVVLSHGGLVVWLAVLWVNERKSGMMLVRLVVDTLAAVGTLLMGVIYLLEPVTEHRAPAPIPLPARPGPDLPGVDVLIFCCGEPVEVLECTVDAALAMEYGVFGVTVCDDRASDDVRAMCQRRGVGYLRRPDAPQHYKSGNMVHAIAHTRRPLLLLLDSDMCPQPETLRQLVPYLLAPGASDLGFVQVPQAWNNVLPGDCIGRDRAASSVNIILRASNIGLTPFGGSGGLFRRAALQSSCHPTWTLSEDWLMSLELAHHGWRGVQLPHLLVFGEAPPSMTDKVRQAIRWSTGHIQLLGHWRVMAGLSWRKFVIALYMALG